LNEQKSKKNTQEFKLYVMDIFKIRSFIEEIEKNSSLCDEQNFDDRFEALDLLGFHVMDQIDQLLQKNSSDG